MALVALLFSPLAKEENIGSERYHDLTEVAQLDRTSSARMQVFWLHVCGPPSNCFCSITHD